MSPSDLQEFLRAPNETLDTELKAWLDLSDEEQRAKVAKVLLSLYNEGGGQLVFGFDDKTRLPIEVGRPGNVAVAYHVDKLQHIVSDYSTRRFELQVQVAQREGKDFPVVVVPTGVRSPVAARRAFPLDNSAKQVIRKNAVYVRSTQDGQVATAEPVTQEDWDRLMLRCFDNRETDIGGFFQRNLPGIVDELRKLGALAQADHGPKPEIKAELKISVKKLDEGTRRFRERLTFLQSKGKAPTIPPKAGWREVAVFVKGSITQFPSQQFLAHLFAHQPRVSGWPIWLNSSDFHDPEEHPYPLSNGAWEALVNNDKFPGRYTSPLVDFWHIEPICWFYHRRLYYEDIQVNFPESPGGGFDVGTTLAMVTEAISTATAFAGALSADPGTTHMEFAFRWDRLQGRKLGFFFEPGRDLFSPRPAYDDEALSVVEVELANPRTTLGRYVGMAVKPLFAVFGYTAPQSLVEEIVERTINRRVG